MKFCVLLYNKQVRQGRYFTHEHPKLAGSWKLPCMKAMQEMPEVMVAEADLCRFGLKTQKKGVEGFAKKPTKFMTNSLEMFKTLNVKCKGDHEHIDLMEGRAAAATIYPRGLCRAILRGTIRQARVDRGNLVTMKCVDNNSEVLAVEFEEEHWLRYWDDVSGKELRGDLVRAARTEEMETV